MVKLKLKVLQMVKLKLKVLQMVKLTYRVCGFRTVLCELVHQIAVLAFLRVMVATPIMAQLVPHNENLLLSNERGSPTCKTAEARVVYDGPLLCGVCKGCMLYTYM